MAAAFDFSINPRHPETREPGLWAKAVRLAILAVLLLVVVGLFFESIGALCDSLGFYLDRGVPVHAADFLAPPREVRPANESTGWDEVAERITAVEQGQTPVSVVLYINASRTEVGSEYVVTGPPALIEEMAGRAGYRTDAFVQQILGAIEVNGEALRFHEGSHDVPGQGKPATLHLLSGWAQAHGFFAVSLASPPKTRHLRFANKQVVVRTQSVRERPAESGDAEHFGEGGRLSARRPEASRSDLYSIDRPNRQRG